MAVKASVLITLIFSVRHMPVKEYSTPVALRRAAGVSGRTTTLAGRFEAVGVGEARYVGPHAGCPRPRPRPGRLRHRLPVVVSRGGRGCPPTAGGGVHRAGRRRRLGSRPGWAVPDARWRAGGVAGAGE